MWGTPSFSPNTSSTRKAASADGTKKRKITEPTKLSDEELRRRIFANATVLFPSSSTQVSGNAYEIVYGTCPRGPNSFGDESPWQYAMLVRRNPSGDFTPLIRGQPWSSASSWSMALQGLLDATATAIHKKLGGARMPPLGASEELPQYEPRRDGTQ